MKTVSLLLPLLFATIVSFSQEAKIYEYISIVGSSSSTSIDVTWEDNKFETVKSVGGASHNFSGIFVFIQDQEKRGFELFSINTSSRGQNNQNYNYLFVLRRER